MVKRISRARLFKAVKLAKGGFTGVLSKPVGKVPVRRYPNRPLKTVVMPTSQVTGIKLRDAVSAKLPGAISKIYNSKQFSSVTEALIGAAALAGRKILQNAKTSALRKMDEKFQPNAHGPENSDAGVMTSHTGFSESYMAGKLINHYKLNTRIKAMPNTLLKSAMKRYVATKLVTSKLSDATRQRFYSQCGPNQKGLVDPSTFGVFSPTELWVNCPSYTPDATTNPFAFLKQDYYNVFTSGSQAIQDPSQLGYSSGQLDLYYAISSMSIDMEFMNSNKYFPITVKIYVCKAKQNTATTPSHMWLGGYVNGQTVNALDAAYKDHFATGFIDGLSIQTEIGINPTAYPSLSPNFAQFYEIVDLKTCKLGPSDTLNYNFTKEFAKETTIKSIGQTNPLASGDYALMIEFQGDPMIMIPRIDDGFGNPTNGEPIMAITSPSRLRWDWQKYATVHADSVSGQVGTTYTATGQNWIGEINKNAGADFGMTTNTYGRMSSVPGAIGSYYCPVYTDQTEQAAGNISGS